jgi:hypothetical protein
MNLLLAAALLLQDKSAEETFHRIEAALDQAKTIRFKCTWESTGKKPDPITGLAKVTGSAEGWIKEGNRQFFIQQFVTKDQTINKKFICDGQRVASWVGEDRIDKAALANQGKRAVAALSRIGHLSSTFALNFHPQTPEGDAAFDRDTAAPVDGIKTGPADGKAASLIYTLHFPETKQQLACRVWYDPGTLRIFKRAVTMESGDTGFTMTETYERLELNTQIPDATFTIPEEKK